MTAFECAPVNSGASVGFSIAGQIRLADPFTPANITWTEVVASTSEDWGGFMINLSPALGKYGVVLFAIGAASSETLIATLPVAQGYSAPMCLFVPIAVPSGTRISVGASVNTTQQIQGQVTGYPATKFSQLTSFTVLESGPFDVTSGFSGYGRGPSVDAGGVINTKGAYSEISFSGANDGNNLINGGSLGHDYGYFGVLTHDVVAAQSNHDRLWDVAKGAVASETIFLPDYYQRVNDRESHGTTSILWDPEGASVGDRIAARLQSSTADAADRIGSLFLFGLR